MMTKKLTQKQIRGLIVGVTGKSIEDLAKSHGYTKFPFYYTIRGRTKSPKIRQIIAEAVGKPVSEIWPGTNSKERDNV